MRGEQAVFDWAAALGALGHDAGIEAIHRELAEAAVEQGERVHAVDVGANVGWLSFWHLAAGHRVLAFEPNPTCHGYFRMICELNGWPADVRPLAVGASHGEADLKFPPGEEWLGTVQPGKVHHADTSNWASLRVAVVTLDAVVLDQPGERLILKIDTEGNELDVLRGVSRLLPKC